MHLIASWDIPDASWDAVNQRMLDCFGVCPFAHPLSTFYLVKVDDLNQYQVILRQMQQVAKNTGLRFACTAVLNFTPWDGWLNTKEEWDKIREITG